MWGVVQGVVNGATTLCTHLKVDIKLLVVGGTGEDLEHSLLALAAVAVHVYLHAQPCCVTPRIVRMRVRQELTRLRTHAHTHTHAHARTHARTHTHTHTHTHTLQDFGAEGLDSRRTQQHLLRALESDILRN